ncbi:excalibur calcium-binding domain-containing protein [Altererythrobacter fulvus]|uniref:excalibur calcium-binding domain-containing protein n=1 Tax=Caenibius fulvus TaxID=2126012 RepID=UPI0030172066
MRRQNVSRWLGAAAGLALIAISSPAPLSAHGGGLAADGCHMDRKTGTRHCHRGPNAGATSVPKQSLRGSGNGGGGGREVYYPNCSAARAAGAAPVYRGDPGYGKHLDRDGDGKGCE